MEASLRIRVERAHAFEDDIHDINLLHSKRQISFLDTYLSFNHANSVEINFSTSSAVLQVKARSANFFISV